ncbi:NAD-dependent epimerase/dehydratase family protein [Ensifer aridi]|uniref:NAD-dependent epimerase/dehydratase family protein n=1 Tax=Ensifer aridi TaxID=1708715 RepID=UPI000A0FD3D7|nr:NAD-dependent epimerase/dehydratase family protein [Ensifer aridi]
MRVLVTGAGGFLGRGLAHALADRLGALARLVLTDVAFGGATPPGAETIEGDLGDASFLEDLLGPGFDLVFHLASLPGALAEQAPELGYRVNLTAPLEFARGLAATRRRARLVFASSIAVYGDLAGRTVTEATALDPLLSYGAHKRMTEIFLSDMTRRGELSAISLRFPGLVARPPTQSGHGSAFMSLIFHKIAGGEAYECPVPAEASCWWMSRKAAVNALVHAAALSPTSPAIVQPPVLHGTVGDAAAAIERVTGRRALIEWGDDAHLTRLFGAMPPLEAGASLRLGFSADADMDALAHAAFEGDLS